MKVIISDQATVSSFGAQHSPAEHLCAFLLERSRHYERAPVAGRAGREYQRLIAGVFKQFIPEGQHVLDIGCGAGDLLASLKPSVGIGVDFCTKAINEARERHPGLTFECCEASQFRSPRTFDYIVLSDLINDLPDVQRVFEHLHSMSQQRTRLVLNFFNHMWYPILRIAEWIGAKARLSYKDSAPTRSGGR